MPSDFSNHAVHNIHPADSSTDKMVNGLDDLVNTVVDNVANVFHARNLALLL